LVNRIYEFLKLKKVKSPILDFSIDPDLIGGAIVEHSGKIKDYSLRENFNRALAEIKAQGAPK
jgi:F0F1-type ATP synthase delta subunit